MPNFFIKRLYCIGFSLVELLIVILMISILLSLGVGVYRQYVIKAYRYGAKISLIQLAVRLENYYQSHDTYEGADKIQFTVLPEMKAKHYEVKIMDLSKNQFMIQAVPLGEQTKDSDCGILGLDEMGRKTVTGMNSVDYCWQ